MRESALWCGPGLRKGRWRARAVRRCRAECMGTASGLSRTFRGLGLDRDAVNAAVTHPFHNGGTEGVNTKTKLIKRQIYGRAGFALLRHRILLG